MSEQNYKLTKEQILDQAKDFAYKMAEGKNRLGKNYPLGLMIGYDSGYRQAIKDSGSLIQTYATGEQNEKLTAGDIIKKYERNASHIGGSMVVTSFDAHRMLSEFAARQVEHATAELRKELERWKQKYDDIYTGHKDALAKVEKDRDEKEDLLDGQYHYNVGQDIEIGQLQVQLAEAQCQRDEANTILRQFKRLAAHGNLQDLADFDAKVCDHLSRLSSGETKPVSPWMHVNVYQPEPHKWYLVATPFCAYPSMAGQYNGEKWISTDQKESEIYNVEYYMEHPAPPESLTDKK